MNTKNMYEKTSCFVKKQKAARRMTIDPSHTCFSRKISNKVLFIIIIAFLAIPLVQAKNVPLTTQSSPTTSQDSNSNSSQNTSDLSSQSQATDSQQISPDSSAPANAPTFSPAQFLPPQNYLKAKVLRVIQEGTQEVNGAQQPYQQLELHLDDGTKNGQTMTLSYGVDTAIREDQKLHAGDTALVAQTAPDPTTQQPSYYIYDTYRLPPVWLIGLLFFGLVVLFGRWKGFASFIGLLVSILVLAKIIVPAIVAGWNPFVVSFVGSIIIAVTSLYLAHGFNKRTTIALISTLATLVLSAIFSIIFVQITHLSGIGSDDASYLQLSSLQNINLRGLLLGAIMIGSLGVLDDVTTGQVAAIYEIKEADPRLTFAELYKRGLNVGREHIASLVNTLVLAYAGASLPLFLIFSADAATPFWVSFNSESIIEEVVRTIVGSTSLVFAVPISTVLAAYYFSKKHKN